MRVAIKTVMKGGRFRELSRQGQEAAYRRNVELAELTVDIAKQLAPVRTGALRDSIKKRTDPVRKTTAAVAEAEYAAFVELGTVYSAPQPFLKPAAELAVKRSRNRSVRLYRG